MGVNRDDIIYATLLAIGIAFGNYYRKIKDVDKKKIVGFVTFIVCQMR
jgi:hypothetical protein